MAADSAKVSPLEDRITMPESKESVDIAGKEESTKPSTSDGMKATALPFVPGQPRSWADEVNSPVDANPPPVGPTDGKPDEDDLGKAQADGAGEFANGTPGVYEPSYDVDVKLNDIQADPKNPLFSVKSFEELNL